MFEVLTAAKPDPILGLMELFRDDPRPSKVDLGVGVYKDITGRTPIMKSIKEAEQRLLLERDSKSYVGTVGDRRYNAAMINLLLGADVDERRVRACQTPGGS